ncbi:MAG: CoA transferase, partial [Clostridia bacterium]|nr:CoA transferase [Clostridia bacterium]
HAPLAGVRVLDLTQVMAGPFCTMLLGDMGADVVKVEPPEGDPTRYMAGNRGTESPSFWALNRNKRSVVLNLKDPRGREVARRLARSADILVENYRPGVMRSFGLAYEDLAPENPGLVYASISGFGQTGPYAERGGFDLVAQGMSGIMSVTGDEGLPPMKAGIPVTDLGAGLLALQAILGAYIHRLREGRGQYLETSLLEAGIAFSVWEAAQYFSGRGVPRPLGSAHRMSAPYQAIRCADGYITVGAANQRTWERLARAIGREDLLARADFRDDTRRVRNRGALVAEIESVTRARPRAHWLRLFEAAGVPAGPILDYAEVFADPHVRAREVVRTLEHPVGGTVRFVGPVVRMSETPPEVRLRPPLLGEHTVEVLVGLGLDEAEVRRLLEDGVAAGPPPVPGAGKSAGRRGARGERPAPRIITGGREIQEEDLA